MNLTPENQPNHPQPPNTKEIQNSLSSNPASPHSSMPHNMDFPLECFKALEDLRQWYFISDSITNGCPVDHNTFRSLNNTSSQGVHEAIKAYALADLDAQQKQTVGFKDPRLLICVLSYIKNCISPKSQSIVSQVLEFSATTAGLTAGILTSYGLYALVAGPMITNFLVCGLGLSLVCFSMKAGQYAMLSGQEYVDRALDVPLNRLREQQAKYEKTWQAKQHAINTLLDNKNCAGKVSFVSELYKKFGPTAQLDFYHICDRIPRCDREWDAIKIKSLVLSADRDLQILGLYLCQNLNSKELRDACIKVHKASRDPMITGLAQKILTGML